jgi:hypothetical protein
VRGVRDGPQPLQVGQLHLGGDRQVGHRLAHRLRDVEQLAVAAQRAVVDPAHLQHAGKHRLDPLRGVAGPREHRARGRHVGTGLLEVVELQAGHAEEAH